LRAAARASASKASRRILGGELPELPVGTIVTSDYYCDHFDALSAKAAELRARPRQA